MRFFPGVLKFLVCESPSSIGRGGSTDDLYDLVTLRKLSVGMFDKINTNYRRIVAVNGTLLVLGVLGVITPSASSMVHNLSTMLFGALSTKSVLDEKDYNTEIQIEAVEVADAA